MKQRYVTTVCCLIALAATPALALETWLLPSAFASPPEKPIAFDLTSGMGFPESEHPISALRVVLARAKCGSHQADIVDVEDGKRALRFQQTFPVPGLATVWVSLGMRDIDLTDDQVEEYFKEIGATDNVRAAWSALKGKEAWHETYVKHAKTFVAVGDARADRSWASPAGLAMELIPMTSPLELRAGGEAQFELRMDGDPIPGVPVGILVEGGAARRYVTTDGSGRASFKLERPGRTLVFATHLRRDPDGPGWRSDFSTLTLNVGAP